MRSGYLGASIESLLPLLSSAKEHSKTGPPGPLEWYVQSDTWTSQCCTFYHTSLSQRAAFPPRPSTFSSSRNKEEPVKRDDTRVAPVRGCSRLEGFSASTPPPACWSLPVEHAGLLGSYHVQLRGVLIADIQVWAAHMP